ncbi:MAG: Na+/H+ antiporter subunit E [Nitrospiraceae bacterium]
MNPGRLKTILLKASVLFGLWLVLSGKYNFFHMTLGLGFSLGVAWLNTRPLAFRPQVFPWARFLLYLPWLFTRIVHSSIHLTYLILHPRLPINPRLIPYHTKLRDRAAVVLLGNSITLTPGTITVEISSHDLVVHAMDDLSAGDLNSGGLEAKIAGVFHQGQGAS